MKLSLLNEEVEVILKALKGEKVRQFWWIESIEKKIQSEKDLIEEAKQCEHIEGTYKGVKTCCAKCNFTFKEGQGESWTLIE